MKKIVLSLFVIGSILTSCSSDDDNNTGNTDNNIVAPTTFEFTRDGSSTVSFSGQTTRIQMAEEIVSALKDNNNTETIIDGMFAHIEGDTDFSDADLNASNKSVRSKTAASQDYFSANLTGSNAIKADFDGWIASQATVVFRSWDDLATPGNAGQLQQSGGGSIRYINEKGLEYNQAFAKGLIGALMIDQILNNYLSPAVLDAGSNIENNDNGILDDGKNYTTMEHKWDEAYGYLYGNEANPATPVLEADQFLSEYTDRVEKDTDFTGIADNIYNAFKLGRAAIVAKDYALRDEQAEILRENISLIPAVRAVFYLQAGKNNIVDNQAGAFHALSEAYGFIYSLQFTRKPNSTSPYFSKSEVDTILAELMEGNGFWDVTPQTLDRISELISAEFGFTTAQAAN